MTTLQPLNRETPLFTKDFSLNEVGEFVVCGIPFSSANMRLYNALLLIVNEVDGRENGTRHAVK